MLKSHNRNRFVFLLSVLLIAVLPLSAKPLAHMYKVEGNVEKQYNELVEKKIKTIGYKLSDPHKRVNDGYKEKYGSTDLDVLSFMSIVNAKEVNKLIAVDPRIAGFAPFNMLIYKKLSENNSYVGHLDPELMLDITGVKDAAVRESFIKSFEPLDALIAKEIGGEKQTLEYTNIPDNTMMNFEMEFERAEDLDDSIDEIQESFEEIFEENQYIIAGFINLKEADDEDALEEFDAFWVYSLCHFKYSYTVFDGQNGIPAAGLFAPCSMYMYIKKDSSKLVVGMPRLDNWAQTLGVTDAEKMEFMKQLDVEIPNIMKELGAVEILNQKAVAVAEPVGVPVKTETIEETKEAKHTVVIPESKPENTKNVVEITQGTIMYRIELPKVPEATAIVPTPVLVTVGGTTHEIRKSVQDNREIIFSKRIPPAAVAVAETTTSSEIGEIKNGSISAYLRAPLMSADDAKAKLEASGFKVLSINELDKGGKLKVIVFSNAALESMANKKTRGFMASLRLLIDQENNQISISNPLYFAKAFMQDDYDDAAAKNILADIKKAFGGLQDSSDNLKHHKLAEYHFMMSMPYYEDMIKIGSADSTEELLKRIQAYEGGKNLIFTQRLSKDRVLVGIELDKRTSKFIKKTGHENALLLPYPVLLEDGEAKILDPKYYIAISYPMLKMSEFMKIATVPGAIEVDSEKLFK